MDALVAQYSRPAHLQEQRFSETEEFDYAADSMPNLSLKFAMPPVAQVCLVVKLTCPICFGPGKE